MGFPEDIVMEEPTIPALEFTEALQVSYNPDMGLYENVKECDCSQICKEVIDSMKMSRWPKGSRKKGARYGRDGKELIRRALDFAKELKNRLKETCARVVFQQPTEITALALGISRRTLNRMGYELQEEPRRQKSVYNRKKMTMATVTRYGPQWGDIVKQAIHGRLRNEENVTIADLHEELSSAHEDFTLSRATLHRLVRGLGFSFKKNPGQKFIFERSDLVAKRDHYLRAIASARERGEYLVYMDETWVFSGMTKPKGWNDNNIPRFAPRSTFARYSYGKTASKNKGRRAIVIGALAEDGIIPECTRVFVSGMVDDGDYHREMNHTLFESWLRDCCRSRLIRDRHESASKSQARLSGYGQRAVPYATGGESAYIFINQGANKGIPREKRNSCGENSYKTNSADGGNRFCLMKKNLNDAIQLNSYVEEAGGYSALRSYATERICNELGVNLIRLPPFHCFFNPIELCWGQLKGFLNKCGKITDNIGVVHNQLKLTQPQSPLYPTPKQEWIRRI
ncbi:unnamed protein product [Cylicocyclus nassatus]|uniref:Uncharacterized protein n=1 Tax=Cylicocyclus nassatus TaxID=53992 RepID=A0AA36DMG6_CYLNA|nr:unnamed protein product [Cylicocyclus nassatus]